MDEPSARSSNGLSSAVPARARERANLPRRIIKPRHEWWRLGLREVWGHSELMWLLTRRAITNRYEQMALGFSWSFLEPLALLVTLAIVFGFFLRIETPYPYPLFVFSALIPWLLFSKATMDAAGSLQENIALISKVYFPRLLLPFSAVLRNLFDSVVIILLLIGLAFWYGHPPSWRIIFVPFVLLYVTVFALGIGLWVSSALVKVRDLRPLLTIVLQLGFYFSPVLFPPSLVPPNWMWLFQLNPMYWSIEYSRWAFLAQPVAISPSLYASIAFVGFLFVSGLFVFSYSEKASVDVQ